VAACSSMVDMLCSLLGSSRVPLAIALILVDLKVKSTLRFGRWLWALSPETLPCLEVAYDNVGKAASGASPWNNGDLCQFELGCRMEIQGF